MPIIVNSEIRVFSEPEFHALAEQVIGVVFDVHNDFGCLMEEDVYKQTIHARCVAQGIAEGQREVEIQVAHRDFRKSYFMDLLFASGLMVEAKTVEHLNKKHRAQTIHYLLLAGMQHGLLINLRPSKVEKQFVSTTLDLEQRREYYIEDSNWTRFNASGDRMRDFLSAILDDWGAFLQISLYRDAIAHFFSGAGCAKKRIPVFDNQHKVGQHEVCLIADDTCLAMTAVKSSTETMQNHLQRFLCHTNLSCLQWVNFNNHEIRLQTIVRI